MACSPPTAWSRLVDQGLDRGLDWDHCDGPPRPLQLPARPGLLLQQEPEPGLEHLLGRGVRDGVREGTSGLLKLLQELPADRDVEAAQVGGERLDVVAGGSSRAPSGLGWAQSKRLDWLPGRECRRTRSRRDGRVCRWQAPGRRPGWLHELNHPDRLHPGHEVSGWRVLPGRQFGGDLLGLAGREAEVPGQHLVQVLLGEDLGELGGGRHAEPAVAQGCDDLGEALDQPRRAEAPVCPAPRETELDPYEGEEVGVPKRLPATPPVEVGQRDEEVGHRRLLLPEEDLERVAELPCFQECEGGGGRSVQRSRGRGRGRVRV
jgi:hypothetical protein